MDSIVFSLGRKMMVLNKASSVQPKTISRWNGYNNNYNGNISKKRRQKNYRRPPSLNFLSWSASTSLAIIYFHALLFNGAELTTAQPARPNIEMKEQTNNNEPAVNEFRNVRREIMLEEAFMYTNFLSTNDPTSDPSEESNESNLIDDDDMETDPFLVTSEDDYIYNATEGPSVESPDDIFLEDTVLENLSEAPSEMSSASPSETNFLPVAVLEDPEDPINQLGLDPSNEPTDVRTSDRIDLTAEPTPGFFNYLRTEAPSINPTNSSAPTETYSPTKRPIFSGITPISPNPPPTAVPTSKPSLRPTLSPTKIPTNVPSSGPTGIPTDVPTGVPSDVPTYRPTYSPTHTPTSTPTGIPTSTPSSAPSFRPTRIPTNQPSRKPTHQPTRRPTHLPTRKPTPQPTQRPTDEPTFRPSTTPTLGSQDPTPSGSFEPTLSPEPSVSPSISKEPTYFPTGTPSARPTFAPTLALQTDDVRGNMRLQPLPERLRGRDVLLWETETEKFIKRFLNQVEPSISIDEIRANIEEQIIIPEGGTRTRGRFLQEANSDASVDSLVIQFDVLIRYRSVRNDYDINQLVWSAFDSPEKQNNYILTLQRASEVFDPINEATVDLEGYIPPTTQAPKPDSGGNIDVAVIVGASVGAVALIILIVLLCLRRRSSKSVEEKGVTETNATPSTTKNIKVSTEILVEPQDDVSTLGDPMFGQGGMMMRGVERDEMTATVGDDYDYTKHYRNTRGPLSLSGTTNTRDRTVSEDMSKMSSVQSVSMSKLGKMGENIFADDASFEEQFVDPEERLDVVAPAGKLGMVIDTPNGGIPVVHAIKDTSVLVDQVRVGDRLLSVDGEDCTGMTAMQVSKLISLKSEKPARVLVFARSSTNPNPTQ